MSLLKQIKNVLDQKVNAATEDTLGAINAKTGSMIFDSDSSNPKNLEVNLANSINLGVNNNAHDIASKTTLDAISTQTTNLTFDNNSALVTTGKAPDLADSVQTKDTTQTTANSVTSEKLILWRRMVKLMESQATVSSTKQFDVLTPDMYEPGNCQRIVVDGWGSGVIYGSGPSDPLVPLMTLSTGSITTPTGITQGTAGTNYPYMGWNNRKFVDVARIAYAKNIRRNLAFK